MESTKRASRGSIGWLILIIAVVFGAGVWIANYTGSDDQDNNSAQTESITENIVLEGEEGRSVLEILEAKYEVKKQTYDFGTMVQAINGLEANESYFWAFYVNGQMANQSAESLITKQEDLIEWRYEAIE